MSSEEQSISDLPTEYRSILQNLAAQVREDGETVSTKAMKWGSDYLRVLGPLGMPREGAELLDAGCKLLPLAVCLKASSIIETIPGGFYGFFGSKERLKGLQAEWEETATLFDGLSRLMGDNSVSLWPDTLRLPHPAKMAQHLRGYAEIGNFIPDLLEVMNVHSFQDVQRTLLAMYVKHATGGWHDREVSVLYSAATKANLDEGTQRTWRNRNYKQDRLPLLRWIWQGAEVVQECHYNAQLNQLANVT